MEYLELGKNVERIYSVSFDSLKLEELLDQVIKNASYREKGKIVAPREAKLKGKKSISGCSLLNGDPLFENIKDAYLSSQYDEMGSREERILVTGEMIHSPILATLIYDVLKEKEGSINHLLDYENSQELIPIDEKIAKQLDEVNSIDNFDFGNKIHALEILRELVFAQKNHQYSDVELLKKYYSEVLSNIELKLISEKVVKNGDKILLIDYKSIDN